MYLSEPVIAAFRSKIWDFYRARGRDLPWRRVVTPYGVFVSEVMLQQTQVSRVLERWPRWLRRFDGFGALAGASLGEVLEEWQGMGYNRRALWLRAAAARVVEGFGGILPREPEVLATLAGVGPNTAGSVAAFAYGVPAVFIETNIRRVFIYEFFSQGEAGTAIVFPGGRTHVPALPASIPDSALRPLIEATLDRERPREWYWALMDYGADLAKCVENPNRRSRHYSVQSRFEGSVRQLRGEVLRRLLTGPKSSEELALDDERLARVLAVLVREGFLVDEGGLYKLA